MPSPPPNSAGLAGSLAAAAMAVAMQQGGNGRLGGSPGGSQGNPSPRQPQGGRKRSALSVSGLASESVAAADAGGGPSSPGDAAGGEGAAKRQCGNEALDTDGRPYRYIVKVYADGCV